MSRCERHAETAIGVRGRGERPAAPLSPASATTIAPTMSKTANGQETTGVPTAEPTDDRDDHDPPATISDHAAERWDARTNADSASPEQACERAIRLAGYHAIECEWPDLSVRFDAETGTVLLLGEGTGARPTLVTVLRHEQLQQTQAAYVGAGVRDRVAEALAEWQGDDPDLVREVCGRVELGGGGA